jgi:enediyne biosynthesis protein E4
VLLTNDGTGHFARNLAPGLEPGEDSRALIAFDYDRDGDEDILITNENQPARLLENVSTNQGHWLHLRLIQEADQVRNGIGATIRVRTGGTTKRREIICGGSYLAGVPAEAHFGLGEAAMIEELTIQWPDGESTMYADVMADQFLTISRVAGDCHPDGLVNGRDIRGFVSALLGESDAPFCDSFADAPGGVVERIQEFIDSLIE